jgi:hypothetical protein
MHTCCF